MSTITITAVGLNLYRDASKGSNTPFIRYVALGTGNSAPSSANTKLDAEAFRKAVTSYVNGTTGEVLVDVYIAPGDAVGVNVAEIGFFGGSSASTRANTGVLVGRALYSHPGKSNTESIQGQMDLVFTAV